MLREDSYVPLNGSVWDLTLVRSKCEVLGMKLWTRCDLTLVEEVPRAGMGRMAMEPSS